MNSICLKQGKYKSVNLWTEYLISRYLRSISTIIGGKKYRYLLDVGCGEGVPLLHFLPEFPEMEKVYGLDLDEDKLLMIKKNIPQGNFLKGIIYDLPYRDNAFDLVLCLEVLEHLDFPGKAMHEMKRISSKDVLLSVPNEPLWSYLNILRLRYLSNFGNTPSHCQKWTSKEFQDFVKQYFTIKSVNKVLPWTIIFGTVEPF